MNNEIYYRVKILRKFIICRREYFTSAMQELLNNPDDYLDKATGPFFKNISGDTTTVAVVTVGDKKFVIKRYNPKSIWHSFKNIFRQSRALRSWKNSHHLERQNISTPKPVAVLIERFGPILGKAYFIAEYVEGMQGRDLFTKDSKPQKEWEKMFDNVARLLGKLYDARISHDDFQQNNMIFVNDIPVLLDLDYMRIHQYNSFWFRYNFRKDVKNFLRILGEKNPEAQCIAKNSLCKGNDFGVA